MPTLSNHSKILLCIFALVQFHDSKVRAQAPQIKDHLQLHIPFDGDKPGEIRALKYIERNFRYASRGKGAIANEKRMYDKNDVLKIGTGKPDSVILQNVPNFPLSISFWMRLKNKNASHKLFYLFMMQIGEYKFIVEEKRGNANNKTLFTLRLYNPKSEFTETRLETLFSTEHWQQFTIQVDSEGRLNFSISNTIYDTDNTTLDRIAYPEVNYSAPAIDVSKVIEQAKAKGDFRVAVGFMPQIYNRDIYVDDIRVYDKLLTKEDLNAIAINDPYKSTHLGKYQLAYSYKMIGDEYYLKASDINRTSSPDPLLVDSARKYYGSARDALLSWINTSTAEGQALRTKLMNFQFSSIKDMDLLVKDMDKPQNRLRRSLTVKEYYDLLLFDLNYRIQLLESGYSFWGKDFTEKPLFPVQEYTYFADAFGKFNTTYQKIEALLKTQQEMDERQETNELQSQLAFHRTELERVKIDESQFKVDFYARQSGNMMARMQGIEARQKQLNREVERKEQELKKMDARIMSSLSGAISQATIGVRIDVTEDLRSQLTRAGINYLAGDAELSRSLLGSYKDVYDVAVTARDYYHKGKELIGTVKSIAEGKISADNLMKIGDAVAGSGLVDTEWSKQWGEIKRTYTDVNTQYQKAKELFKKIEMTIKNPNMKDIVGLVDWVAASPYIPDNYREQYQQFKEYREAAYTAVKEKRYGDIINLGTKMFTDQGLANEVTRIQRLVNDLKPAMLVFEMVKNPNFNSIRDKLIGLVLDGTVDDFIDEKVRQSFLYKILKQYLSDPSRTQREIETLYTDLLQHAPEAILESFPFRAKEDLFKIFGVQTYRELITKLRTFSFAQFPNYIHLNRDVLYIYGEPYPIDVSKYLNLPKADIDAFIAVFKRYQGMLNDLVNLTSPLELYKLFEKRLIDDPKAPDYVKALFSVFKRHFSGSEMTQVNEEAVKFYLGNGAFQAAVDSNEQGNLIKDIPDLVDPSNPTEIPGENLGPMPEGDNSQMMLDMAAKALDMAFPGVGTAASTVLKIADAIFSGYQIVDELRGIYSEKVDLNKEYVKLMDNLRENEFNKQIGLYETRINNIAYSITLQEHDGFSRMVNNITDRKKDVRRKIGGQLPMLFFYAERMRYYYQRLNKSSTFWYGQGNSLNKIIFSDPNNIRLALDPHIKLFDWITNPDVTSSREDIFRLYAYWSKINALVTDGLTSNRLKYGENVSEISYQVLDLKDIDGEQWRDLTKWQKNPNLPFHFDMDLTDALSDENPLGFDSSYTSIKCIQVIPVAIGAGGRKIQNLLTVSNLGISLNEAGAIEPLGFKSRSSGDDQMEIDNNNELIVPALYLNSLRYRWNSSGGSDYQPFNFEGYNVRSNWKVSVAPNNSAQRIEKILLVLFYQYTKDYSKLQSNIPVEYLYKVKVPVNPVSGAKETLIITLPEDPSRRTPSEQLTGLEKKYPYLKSRVVSADLEGYKDEGHPLIVNRAARQNLKYSKISETPAPAKKKCFLKRLFK